jgi:hypothetical protein
MTWAAGFLGVPRIWLGVLVIWYWITYGIPLIPPLPIGAQRFWIFVSIFGDVLIYDLFVMYMHTPPRSASLYCADFCSILVTRGVMIASV